MHGEPEQRIRHQRPASFPKRSGQRTCKLLELTALPEDAPLLLKSQGHPIAIEEGGQEGQQICPPGKGIELHPENQRRGAAEIELACQR